MSAGYLDGSRGCGIADLAGTPSGATPRTDGAVALHVLDVMESLLRSAADGVAVDVASTCERPSAVPLGRAADLP
ncbi:hypothetical protein CLV30_11364 [Haloactinopolyspora alba]|uniref:Uncharacterized protein n=1 Tax=Haloactinopolyspora alba TaxID=648780 RepID=A0A2P8DWH5_9ACTN|nr:hypothetical protein [Haloactinopolyspora alba]PSL01576.1 hypothetical protein CLV30_11364 [Haloactinopolyspora alba]